MTVLRDRDQKPPAFILGMTVNGLSILKSLGRRGIVTYGADADPTKIGFFSRYCRHRVLLEDPLKEPGAVLDKIRKVAAGTRTRPVLFLASDDYLGLFAAHYRELESLFLHSLPAPEVIDRILDKRKLAAVAEEAGVPHPRTLAVASPEEAAELAPTLHYPVLIKPAVGYLVRRQEPFLRRKLIVAEDARSLVEMLRTAGAAAAEMMIQELVPGPDSAFYKFRTYYSRAGKPLACFTDRKVRQYPIHYGYGCAMESVWEPEVARLGRKLLDALGYRGIGGVEFKRDERDGRFKLIEVNGRTAMNEASAIASGIDTPWIAYRDLTGETVEEVREFEQGVKWFRVRHDLAAYRQYRREGSLSLLSWLRSYRGRKVYSTFSGDDPFSLVKRFVWGVLRWLRVPLSAGGFR